MCPLSAGLGWGPPECGRPIGWCSEPKPAPPTARWATPNPPYPTSPSHITATNTQTVILIKNKSLKHYLLYNINQIIYSCQVSLLDNFCYFSFSISLEKKKCQNSLLLSFKIEITLQNLLKLKLNNILHKQKQLRAFT